MVPVLLPLMMAAASRDPGSIGYVMGVYNLGLMTSLLWGTLAERRRLYRSVFFTGFVLSIAAIAVFPLMRSITGWMPVAFVLGAGSSGAATAASLLIVDFEPAGEWEPRIGMLQSFNGVGQVVGLLLAGVFADGAFSIGLWITAALLLPTLVLSRLGLPAASTVHHEKAHHAHRFLDMRALAIFPHISQPAGLHFHFHALNVNGVRQLPKVIRTPFGRFLVSWFLLSLGVAGLFTYFPVMLKQSYGMSSHISSIIYALMAGIGIALFVMAGRWSQRFGAGRIYQVALWIRLVGFLLLTVPLVVPVGGSLAFAEVGFGMIVVAWPILSVAGTNLAASLTPVSEGAAMGLLNSALSSATVIGALASAPLLTIFGNKYLAISGLVGVGLAVVTGLGLPSSAAKDATPRDSYGPAVK